MFAVLIAPIVISSTLAVWLFAVSLLAILFFGSVTAPAEFRRVTCGLAVAVAVSVLIAVPQIIIRCPEWWIGCQ